MRNISSGGLMARIYWPVDHGKPARVELASGQLVAGTILWERDWVVGIAFTDAVDVEALLAEQGTEVEGDRRRTRRIQVECLKHAQGRASFPFRQAVRHLADRRYVQTRGVLEGRRRDAGAARPAAAPGTIRWR